MLHVSFPLDIYGTITSGWGQLRSTFVNPEEPAEDQTCLRIPAAKGWACMQWLCTQRTSEGGLIDAPIGNDAMLI